MPSVAHAILESNPCRMCGIAQRRGKGTQSPTVTAGEFLSDSRSIGNAAGKGCCIFKVSTTEPAVSDVSGTLEDEGSELIWDADCSLGSIGQIHDVGDASLQSLGSAFHAEHGSPTQQCGEMWSSVIGCHQVDAVKTPTRWPNVTKVDG